MIWIMVTIILVLVINHTLRVIEGPGFRQRFKHKGRFAELMGRIPIHVVVTPAAITGAAAYGLENSIPNSS